MKYFCVSLNRSTGEKNVELNTIFYSFSYSSISGEKSSFIFFLKALLLLRFIIIIQFYKFTCFFRKRFFFLLDFLPLFWSCFVQKKLFLHKTQKLLYRIRKTFGYVFLGFCCRCFFRILLLFFLHVAVVLFGCCRHFLRFLLLLFDAFVKNFYEFVQNSKTFV